MESGKRAEAGPSTTSTGSADEKQERQKKEVSEKPPTEAVIEGDDDEDEDDGDDNGVPVAGFVPGPLLSLKEQIEKDKVFIYHSFVSILSAVLYLFKVWFQLMLFFLDGFLILFFSPIMLCLVAQKIFSVAKFLIFE